ncbi:MAG: hypothetical protein WA734_01000 [Candidatus Acidiferrales bacterium]
MPTHKSKTESARPKLAARTSRAKSAKLLPGADAGARAAAKASGSKSTKLAKLADSAIATVKLPDAARTSAKAAGFSKIPNSAQARMKIGEAMRGVGLDEARLARLFRGLLRRLNKSQNEKLLLDAAKETCRLLEAYPAARSGSNGPGITTNVPIQLITVVPRPDRAAAAQAEASPAQAVPPIEQS